MEDTAVSATESRRPAAGVLARAALAGVALGIAAFAAGSLILYEAQGVLSAAGGLVATFAAALAAGVWAGSPGARTGQPPTWRWVGAGIALALAGGFGTLWVHFGWERFGGTARALALLFLVGVPVYAIGFLLPALTAWSAEFHAAGADEDDDERTGRSPAARGVEETVLAVLLGLAAGAVMGGLVLIPAFSPGPLLLGVGALLTFPLVFPREMPAAASGGERVLHEEETPYGVVRVAEMVHPGGRRQPELRLYVNDELESGELERTGAPTFGYIAAAERLLRDTTSNGAAYLFLGGGACTLPRRIAEDDPGARITVVELDPAITRAAYRWFGLRPEHGLSILHGDARAVASTLPRGGYDRLVVDVYGGDEMVPAHLATVEALEGFRGLLKPGGLVLVNVIGVAAGAGECRFWSTVQTVASVFPAVRLYHQLGRDYPERQNFLLAASAEPGASLPARAGHFDAWLADEWPGLPCAAVLRDRAAGDEAPRAAPPERERGARVEPASAD